MFDIFTPQALKVSVAHLSAQLIQNPLVHAFDTGHGSRILESSGFVLLLRTRSRGDDVAMFWRWEGVPACFVDAWVATMLMLKSTAVLDGAGC
jgi:hypothetical protein